MATTAPLRDALPALLKRYKVKTFVDAPCGDWHWMQHVDLGGVQYIGCDIAASIVEENAARFTSPGIEFRHLDITSDPLPDSDLFMCRDCLFHLTDRMRWSFFENFAQSKSKYLLLTMHHVDQNRSLQVNGGFEMFNPMVAPFGIGKPDRIIRETSGPLDSGQERSLGVWTREQVAQMVARNQTGATQ